LLTGNLAVALAVVDGDGKLRASAAPTLALRFRQETFSQVVQSGNFRIVAQFALPPGRYQLRAAALGADGKNSGAVQYDLDVPDFTKPRLSLSNVALASSRSRVWPSAADKHLDERLPESTAQREFSSDEELEMYVEAYDNQATPAPSHQVDITTTVRASDGRVMFTNGQTSTTGQAPTGRGLSSRIPLKGFSPGLYVLTVEARSRLGNVDPVSQLVPFRVR